METIKCPKCKSKNVSWMKELSGRLIQTQNEYGKISNDGGCLDVEQTQYECNDCGENWATETENQMLELDKKATKFLAKHLIDNQLEDK